MKDKRDRDVHFLVSQSELDLIHKKKNEMEIQSLGAYLRKMALNGYCVKLEFKEIREMISLLRRCSNNINQYAKKANQTDCIYLDDIIDIQNRLDEIWEVCK